MFDFMNQAPLLSTGLIILWSFFCAQMWLCIMLNLRVGRTATYNRGFHGLIRVIWSWFFGVLIIGVYLITLVELALSLTTFPFALLMVVLLIPPIFLSIRWSSTSIKTRSDAAIKYSGASWVAGGPLFFSEEYLKANTWEYRFYQRYTLVVVLLGLSFVVLGSLLMAGASA